MRRPVRKRRTVEPDYLYDSAKVAKLINCVMRDGSKETARKVVYKSLDLIKERTKTENPLDVLDKAFKNVGPVTEVRSRRIGGANYMVPREVRPERRTALTMRWILEAARSRKGIPMYERLAQELIAASNNEGAAVAKKENTHKMAEANKAFAHFAW